MSEEQPRYGIDRRAVRRHFDRAATSAATVDAIPREIASRMRERLDYIRLDPSAILDLGCGGGADALWLAERFPSATVVGVDFSLAQLRTQPGTKRGRLARLLGARPHSARCAAEATALPLGRASFDMVWSNLLLNWADDPRPIFAEAHRVLRVGGMLMFSTLGPDTLKELRAAFPEESVHRFIDMHDIGDALVRAGFADPVMDMQMLSVTYPEPGELFRDLRLGGHANARTDRRRGLTGRRRWQRQLETLTSARGDGRLAVTLELLFGHAWKAEPRTDEQGRSVVRFAPRPTR